MIDSEILSKIKTILDCFYFRNRSMLPITELNKLHQQLFPASNFIECLNSAYRVYLVKKIDTNGITYLILDKLQVRELFS